MGASTVLVDAPKSELTSNAIDVEIDYTNYRGERRIRRIRPLAFVFDANEWHPTPCHQCFAIDLETGKYRHFPLMSIHSWKETSSDPQS